MLPPMHTWLSTPEIHIKRQQAFLSCKKEERMDFIQVLFYLSNVKTLSRRNIKLLWCRKLQTTISHFKNELFFGVTHRTGIQLCCMHGISL